MCFSKMDCLSNTLLYKECVCLKVFAPAKRQYCIPHDKTRFLQRRMLFSFGRSRYYFVECNIILLGNSRMPQIQHFLKKCWYSFEQTCSF